MNTLDPDTIDVLARITAERAAINPDATIRVEHDGAILVRHFNGRVSLELPRGRWSLGFANGAELARELRDLLCIPPEASPISRKLHPFEAL